MLPQVQQISSKTIDLSSPLPLRQMPLSSTHHLDVIRFGNTPSKFGAFFQSIWTNLHLLFSKIFWCFDSIKPLSAKQEKIKQQITMLEGHFQNFNERVLKQDLPQLKQWWNKAFEELDYGLRKRIIYKDIETNAGDAPDKKAWAKKNFNDYRQLATDFVQKLSIVDGYNPLDYVPGYLKEVIEDLEKELPNPK